MIQASARASWARRAPIAGSARRKGSERISALTKPSKPIAYSAVTSPSAADRPHQGEAGVAALVDEHLGRGGGSVAVLDQRDLGGVEVRELGPGRLAAEEVE